jgi:hypothetical protein
MNKALATTSPTPSLGFDVSSLMDGGKLQVTVPYNEQVNVIINHVSRERQSALMRAATKTTWDTHHQAQETFDPILFGQLLGLEAIGGWDGLVIGETPLDCTPENIKLLMRRWTDFAKFVSTLCSDLERLVALEKAAVAKNSETTSGLV